MAAWLVPTQLVRVQVLGGVLLQMGSSSNRKAPVSQAGDPGAIPGGSTLATQSRGPTATTLGSHPGNDGSIPSGTTSLETCPDTPIGRAARLKPERLQVRLLLWVLTQKHLGSVGNWQTTLA